MTNQPAKNKKPPGIQIQQLFTLDYIEKLIESEQNLHTKFRLSQKINHSSQQYRYQSEIEKFLSLPFPQRTAKIIKNSKHFMRDFDCFSVQKNSTKTSTNSHEKSQKHQDHEIIKRDIESLISVFAMYSQIGYYSKGQIIDATGWKGQKIRILLKGQVGIYEPTNKKSFKNCIHKIKEQYDYHTTHVCLLFNNWASKISDGQMAEKQLTIELTKRSSNQLQKESEKGDINESLIHLMLGPQNRQNLSNQNCYQILTFCQIISPITPHKSSNLIQKQGALIVPHSKSSSILNQILDSQTSFTAICLSGEAVLIELDFAIFRQILWLINNDEEKLYITCLMRKFQSLQYFEAQKYLKKKQNIIDYLRSKHQNTNLQFNKNDLQDQLPENQNLEEQDYLLDSAQNLGDQIMTIEERKESIQLNKFQSLQNESSSLYFSIPYSRTPYLIVEGEVIIVTNKVKQQKLIDEKYSLPRKIYTRHQLLKIYENDIFGVQTIGEQSQFSLRYEVRKNSKILKMNKKILKQQIKTISGFQQEFKQFKFKRDRILEQILNKLSKQIEKQMINKYADYHNFKVDNKQIKAASRQIIDFQTEQKDFKTQQVERKYMQAGQKDSSKSRNQISKNSFSLPNIGKFYQTKSSKKYLQNSLQKNKQIALTERKKQEEKSPQVSKINDVEYIGSQQYPELKKQLLEKLSLKQRKRYSAHNQKRLTVQLLKQFNLVGFTKESQNLGSENGDQKAFVEMRDPITGVLLRRRSIPSIQHIEGSKNRQNIEKTIMRKIGLLSEAEKVKHNQKVVRSRKSQIAYENLQEMRRKQQKRLLKISKSLPKLQVFYSKQADIQYKNKAANKF